MDSGTILRVDHLCKSFGAQRVIDDLSFVLEPGHVARVVGANGAGKTTLFRLLTLLLHPDSGSICFNGHDLCSADLRWIGYLPEERGVYRREKVEEQAIFFARLKGLTADEAKRNVANWMERLGMTDWRSRRASTLSKGMQQRLQFLIAVAHTPRLLILDEPFSGFDADNSALLKQQIGLLSAQGTAVLLSTHRYDLAETATMCHQTISLQ
ncbi:MAG: ATP-binding cassette domain-containing protein [Bacteroidales bacterium]|nr:ATP-binding cassette domain-containing protein [Bacteroidales bacterium]